MKGYKAVLVTDTREQQPLEFKTDKFDELRRDGLPFGDYWMVLEQGNDQVTVPLAFERKALGDLFGTMTKGYKRFKKELERAKENKFRLELLIEGSMKTVFDGYLHSNFSGDSMLKKLATLKVRYGLDYHFFNDRREMARYIEDNFDAVRRNFKVSKNVLVDKQADRSREEAA